MVKKEFAYGYNNKSVLMSASMVKKTVTMRGERFGQNESLQR